MNVSIITVSFNSEKTIEQTIQSVIGQTYENIEYIIIDGGSTDATLDIIKKYRDKITYVVSEPDKGIYNAMNKGINAASGDIIGIINSDDWYSPEAVERTVNFFGASSAEVLYGDCIYVYEDGKQVRNMKYPLEAMWYLMVTPHPTVFIKKEIYKKHGVFDETYRMAADYELMLRLYSSGVKFGYLEYDLAFFRSGGSSTKQIILSLSETKEIALKYVNKYHKDEYKQIIHDRYDKRIQSENNKIQLEKEKEQKDKVHNILMNYLMNAVGITVFGTGVKGAECLKRLRGWGIPVKMFVDNNSEKWGISFEGIPVCRPSVLEDNREKIIIASTKYCEEICMQVEKMGYRNREDYIKILDLDAYIIAQGEKMNINFTE
ncbi:MAG: glycosyltransferase [Lachnospiraceae bacterium]|nr:glycosyltransferase [Lachnospiraceae bacterium]